MRPENSEVNRVSQRGEEKSDRPGRSDAPEKSDKNSDTEFYAGKAAD